MRRLRPEPVHWCQVTDDVRQYLCQQPTGLLRINAQLLGNLSDLSATQGLHDLLSRYGQVLTRANPGLHLLGQPSLRQLAYQAADATMLGDQPFQHLCHASSAARGGIGIQSGSQNAIKQPQVKTPFIR